MTHYAFLDGAFGYDCVRCGSRCCHGLGFALPKEALVPLLARAPLLAPFAQLQANGAHVLTFGGGCLMLAGDGRCGVEVEFGRDAKPAVCRLFPMQLFRIGGRRVVDLQLRACPLEDARTLAPGPGVTVVRHADLAAELDALGADALYPEARLAVGAPDDALDKEGELVRATAGLLDAPDPLHAIARDEDRAALAQLRAGWRRFFAVDAQQAAALEARVARPFLLALPSLRLAAITALDAPPWPKLMRRLPARLAASVWLTALAARAARYDDRAVTPRLCSELWAQLPLLRAALARFDEKVTLRDAAPPPGSPAELVIAYAAFELRARDQTLGEALCATQLAPSLRPLLLRLASDRMT